MSNIKNNIINLFINIFFLFQWFYFLIRNIFVKSNNTILHKERKDNIIDNDDITFLCNLNFHTHKFTHTFDINKHDYDKWLIRMEYKSNYYVFEYDEYFNDILKNCWQYVNLVDDGKMRKKHNIMTLMIDDKIINISKYDGIVSIKNLIILELGYYKNAKISYSNCDFDDFEFDSDEIMNKTLSELE